MSIVLDGTAGITFNNSTTQASAGQVLQVVNAKTTTYTSTTSTSYTTIISATITPKFTTSKILILISASSVSGKPNLIFTNNSGTNLGFIFNWSFSDLSPSGGSTSYLDSPASTSALTYSLKLASSNGSTAGRINDYATDTSTTTITLMEIAA